MLKTLQKTFLAFQLLCALSGSPSGGQVENTNSWLGASRHDYRLVADNFAEGLIRVAQDLQIPAGIQWVDLPTARVKVDMSWRDATGKEIVEAIVRTQPGYDLAVRNGILHVFPVGVPADQNFLTVQVGSFAVHNQVVQVAARKLRALVQLTTAPPKAGMTGGIGGSLAVSTAEPKMSVSVENASAEDALDALVTHSEKKIWVVTFLDNAALTPSGFRRTRTLWNNSPVPNDQEPVWDMFGWGERIPSGR